MPIPPHIVSCYKYIDAHTKQYIEELRQIVKIANVSSDPDAKTQLGALIRWMSNRIKGLGFNIILKEPDYEKYKANN